MKNQNFGENRDIFKYDLIHYIMDKLKKDKFSIISMLTEDDGTSDDSHRDREKVRAGKNNEFLIDFLDDVTGGYEWSHDSIRSYFKQKRIEALIYDPPDFPYFSNKYRIEYFNSIPKALLKVPLVFLDPDAGFEPANPSEKHLKYSELRDMMARSGVRTLFVAVQYFDRRKRTEFIKEKLDKLKKELKLKKDCIHYISDGEMLFLVLSRDDKHQSRIKKILIDYENDYKNIVFTDVKKFYS